MNHLTVKENTFTLEINESQSTKNFSVVVIKLTETIYTQEFDRLETAIETGKAIFKAVVKLCNYRDLADKAKQEALFAQKDKDFVREALFLQQATFYEEKYKSSKMVKLLTEQGKG